MKTSCPYCAEDIKEQATVCPHCQRDLTFYKPIATKLGKLEERIERIEQIIVALSQQSDSQVDTRQSVLHDSGRIYLVSIIFSSVVSVGLYAIYLWVESSRPISLWISIIIPLLTGTWLGYKMIDRSLRNYIIGGIVTGILTAAGITLCVYLHLLSRQGGQGSVDWGAVLRLYFLPPIFLITFGGFVGEWFHNIGDPRPPMYARELAEILSSTSNTKQEEQIELLAKRINAIAPILTGLSGVISSWLVYIKPSGN